MFKKIPLLIVFMGTSLLVACGQGVPQSSVETVELPQTEIEDQMKVGFCWAYAGTGLVESETKRNLGLELNLSEEALGFYRMAEGLYYWTQNVRGQDLLSVIAQDSMQGWLLSSNEVPDTFKLIEKYGVVPESVWNVKFTQNDTTDKLVKAVRRAMNKKVFNTTNPKTITVEEIISDVLLAPGAWPSEPPRTFVFNNKTYSPQSLLAELKFTPSMFKPVTVETPADLGKLIAASKRALVRGITVPLGFPVNFDRLKADRFTGAGVNLNTPENFFRDGGHAVLIDDFINRGGREGAIPLAEALTEFLKPTSELDYFIFKNSWGKDAETNEAGIPISGSLTGYYKMDLDYLKGSANLTTDESFKGILEIMVPADIAADPFAPEPINPLVASQTL